MGKKLPERKCFSWQAVYTHAALAGSISSRVASWRMPMSSALLHDFTSGCYSFEELISIEERIQWAPVCRAYRSISGFVVLLWHVCLWPKD